MTRANSSQSRLREHPSQRFAGEEHVFKLGEIYSDLKNEPHHGHDGHRQISVLKKDRTTIVAFAFEKGGKMVEHRTSGVVTIHVLAGKLIVETEIKHHQLEAGCILVLEPDVPHSVYAEEESQMLLTVQLVHP